MNKLKALKYWTLFKNIYKIDIHHMFWNQIEIETILSQFVSNNKVVSFHPCCKLSQIFIYIFIYKCILFYHLIWRRGWAHGNKIYHIKFLFISDYQYFRWFLSKSIFLYQLSFYIQSNLYEAVSHGIHFPSTLYLKWTSLVYHVKTTHYNMPSSIDNYLFIQPFKIYQIRPTMFSRSRHA